MKENMRKTNYERIKKEKLYFKTVKIGKGDILMYFILFCVSGYVS